jgi:hypothetical protein
LASWKLPPGITAQWSVKKFMLSEQAKRSEFMNFSGTSWNSGNFHAALIFWFFCIKTKEQRAL